MKLVDYSKLYVPKINEAIKSIFDSKLKTVKNSFLNAYYSELKEYFKAGGKRIRPLLCIAAYNGFKKKNDEKIIFPSIGTEFLHNASLIHDDIIDKDDFRRGNPAFHYRFKRYHEKYELKKMQAEEFGNNIGILGGDSTFFLGLEAYLNNGFELELNMNAIRFYEQVFKELCDGVLIETDMVNQKELNIENYIEMVSLKTGALIEKSLLIGANYARADDTSKKALSSYGINLGIVFQIIDDILGTFGDQKITGKPTDGDIKEGKKTCLLISATNRLDNSDKIKLHNLIETTDMDDESVLEVKKLFEKANVISECQKLANHYFDEAKSALIKLKTVINDSEFEFFDDLLNFVLKRKF